MRQSKLLAQQAINRPRRIEHFRRKTWAPRRVSRSTPFEVSDRRTSDYIPGEFEEAPRFPALSALRRGVGLTSDISLLILLSPFFAVWFLYRAALRIRKDVKR